MLETQPLAVIQDNPRQDVQRRVPGHLTSIHVLGLFLRILRFIDLLVLGQMACTSWKLQSFNETRSQVHTAEEGTPLNLPCGKSSIGVLAQAQTF